MGLPLSFTLYDVSMPLEHANLFVERLERMYGNAHRVKADGTVDYCHIIPLGAIMEKETLQDNCLQVSCICQKSNFLGFSYV